jgi:hypothetical protein
MDLPTEGGGKRGRGAKKNTPSRPRSASPAKIAKKRPSPSNKSRKLGSKGGIDLTPFLTSLLLLGSRMAFDKKNPGAVFSRLLKSAKKGRIAKKGMRVKKTKNGLAKKPRRNYRGGSSAEKNEANILEMFNNTDQDVDTADTTLPNMQGGRRRRSRSPKRKSPTASKRSKSPTASKRSKSPKKKAPRSASPAPPAPHNGGKPKATKPKATKPMATKPKATKPKATKPKAVRAPRSPRRK